MEIKINSYSKQTSLFAAILCFIFGGVLYTNAGAVLSIVSISIGTILGLICIFFTGITLFTHKKSNVIMKTNIFIAILTFILSLIFLLFPEIVEFLLGITIGGWILLTGILRIINAIKLPKKNTRFLTNTIVSLLLIGIGIYTIASGSILIETAGIIMMISAGIEIIGYIINKVLDNDNNEVIYEETIEVTKLITDEEQKEEVKEEPKLITEKKKSKKETTEEIKTEKVKSKRRKRKTKVKDIEAK